MPPGEGQGGQTLFAGALEDPVETAYQFLESNRVLLGLNRPGTLEYGKTHGMTNGRGCRVQATLQGYPGMVSEVRGVHR